MPVCCASNPTFNQTVLFIFFDEREMKGSTLQQVSETWPYGPMQQIQEREGRALRRREVRKHVSTGAKKGENPDRGSHGVRADPPENSQRSATN